jgi:hypothetical protein
VSKTASGPGKNRNRGKFKSYVWNYLNSNVKLFRSSTVILTGNCYLGEAGRQTNLWIAQIIQSYHGNFLITSNHHITSHHIALTPLHSNSNHAQELHRL